MKYRYFYQTKTNENRDGWIAARNRAEAYAALRKQGIRPYRVVGDDPIRWQPWALGALIVLMAALLGVFAYLLLSAPAGVGGVSSRRAQLAGDARVISEGIASDWANVFPSSLDRYLALYAQPGWIALPPPLTDEDCAAFLQAVAEPACPVTAADGAEVRQLKVIVAGMRRELEDYLKSGGTIREYVRLLDERQDEEAEFRMKALETVEGTAPSLRERVRLNMNIRLREKGLREIGG